GEWGGGGVGGWGGGWGRGVGGLETMPLERGEPRTVPACRGKPRSAIGDRGWGLGTPAAPQGEDDKAADPGAEQQKSAELRGRAGCESPFARNAGHRCASAERLMGDGAANRQVAGAGADGAAVDERRLCPTLEDGEPERHRQQKRDQRQARR